jgi:Na+-driven multidrug efflux pump
MTLGLNLLVRPMLHLLHCDGPMSAAVHAYVTVRALGIPFFLISNILEGCLIGLRDAVTPLRVYLWSGVVAAGLMAALATPLVGCQMGIAGCAIAIAIGQVYGAFHFLRVLSQRGLLTVHWKAPLNWGIVHDMSKSVGVMIVGTFARMGTYVTMTAIAASMGIVEGAAHKAAFECYYLMSFATEPMFTAANSLIPRDLKIAHSRAAKLCRLLLTSAVSIGLVLAGLSMIALRSSLFSPDPEVLQALAAISPALAVMLLASSVVYTVEGILVGIEDINYLTTVHCCNFGIMMAYSVVVQRFSLGMQGMWCVAITL